MKVRNAVVLWLARPAVAQPKKAQKEIQIMGIRFIKHSLIAKLAACLLLALCSVQSNVRASQPIGNSTAQTSGTFTLTFNGASVGLAPGQTLRLTGLNGNDPGSRGGSEPVHALATLYDAHGSAIAQSAEVEIPAGEFRSIEFDRDDLALAGELGTGRVQVRSHIRYRGLAIVDRTQLSPPSSEILDKSTGMTTAIVNDCNVDDPRKPGSENRNLFGMVPDQMLRFTVFNQNETDSRRGGITKLGSKLLIIQGDGSYIGQSDEITILAGEFRSFDVKRDDLRLAGEPGTGRLQVRGKIILWVREGSAHSGFSPTISVELINSSTGRTAAATQGRGVFVLSTDRTGPF
jgi:hypothetical protein